MSNTPDIMRPATTSEMRKASPIASGPMANFPAALELVARLCKLANDKHNPGQPMHWSRDKSTDHADCIARHQLEVGTLDPEFNLDHAVNVAWRALAQLQILAETKYGWPVAPGARVASGVAVGAGWTIANPIPCSCSMCSRDPVPPEAFHPNIPNGG